MKMSFDSAQDVQAWKSVNDGVMGGRSSGSGRVEDGIMIFQGVINTNGGGFASLRADMQPGQLTDFDALRLRIKSDGRAYKLSFRTDARARFRPVSFQRNIPVTTAGVWAEVSVPLDGLAASVFGRAVRGAQFDKSNVRELGIILADGQDGPFKLEIDWIAGQ